MRSAPVSIARPRYYGLFWRWHFFAALIVIPFVLWQGTTGVLYLWSEWWMDRAHPQLRFVDSRGREVAPTAQVAAALATLPRAQAGPEGSTAAPMPGMGMDMATPAASGGPAVLGILLPDDPRRSTTVLLQSPSGLAYPVFVDPYTARVLGTLTPAQWIPGWTRSLHGGWPLGKPGSWLLELGDCWAIVMLLTGFYLWWPRGRFFPEALWPRFNRGPRVLLRDLHATAAVLVSAVFLFFLISALPWTSFWGETLLPRFEAVTGQSSPAPFSMGGASASGVDHALGALDEAVREARRRGVRGTLDVRLSPWAGAGWWIANVRTPAPDHTLLATPGTGRIAKDVTSSDLPAIPLFVALGIHVHQGEFGPVNLWTNTALAFSCLWLSVTGALSWWVRRPRRSLGAPPKSDVAWPFALRAGAALMCVLLPIFGLSVVVVAATDRITARLRTRGFLAG